MADCERTVKMGIMIYFHKILPQCQKWSHLRSFDKVNLKSEQKNEMNKQQDKLELKIGN